jgi:hypothetical protein
LQRAGSSTGTILHWVVQRNVITGALITFKSFADHKAAERHKAELEAIADPLGRTNVLAIESLPIREFPKMKLASVTGQLQPRQPNKPLVLSRFGRCNRSETTMACRRRPHEVVPVPPRPTLDNTWRQSRRGTYPGAARRGFPPGNGFPLEKESRE